MVNALAAVSLAHSSHEDDGLLERDAELPLNVGFVLKDHRKVCEVDRIVGYERLRMKAGLDEVAAGVGVKNQGVAHAVDVVKHVVAQLAVFGVPITSFGPEGE